MGFNSAFKGLILNLAVHKVTQIVDSLVLFYSQLFGGAENFHFY
jgi:hypothetical protein